EDLAGALELSGYLEIEKREYLDENLKKRVAWDWVKRPRIHVKPEFQPQERFVTHSSFWRDRNMNATMATKVLERLDRFEHNVHARLDRMELRQLDEQAERDQAANVATMERRHN